MNQEQRILRVIESLCLADDLAFAIALKDNPGCAGHIINTVLGRSDIRVEDAWVQYNARGIDGHSVIFDLLTNPVEIIPDENGWVKEVKCVRMELGEPDASGRRRPVVIEGSEFTMEADTVIMSLGTSPNPLISSTTIGLDTNRRKCIIADEENGQTSKEGVFAGGDAVTGAATVILAMGAGKAAAKGIDEFIKNRK